LRCEQLDGEARARILQIKFSVFQERLDVGPTADATSKNPATLLAQKSGGASSTARQRA